MTTIRLKMGYIARSKHLAFAAHSLRWVVLGLSVVILAVRAGAVLSSSLASPADPFAAYRSIMPGQPAAALEEYTCLEPAPRPPVSTCDIYPEHGLFHLISIETAAGRITQVSFSSHSLQLGDLLHHWGDPDSMRRGTNGRVITLGWGHQVVATVLLREGQPHVRHVLMRIKG